MSVCQTASPAPRLPIGYAVLDHVRDDVDLRMPLDEAPAGLLDRRPVEIAEAAAERDQVVVAERLAAEQQDLMIEPGAMDRRELCRVAAGQGLYCAPTIPISSITCSNCPRPPSSSCATSAPACIILR